MMISDILRIYSLKIQFTKKKLSKPERNKTISATCTATTFVFVEPDELALNEPEQPAGKKKGARTTRTAKTPPKKKAS